MKKIIFGLALTLSIVVPAFAMEIFGYNYSSANIYGYGSLNATDNGNGTYTAFSGSGYQVIGGLQEAITLVFNPAGTSQSISPAGAFTYDNQINLNGGAFLSNDGLLFVSQSEEINIGSVLSKGIVSYNYYDQNLYSEKVIFALSLPGGPQSPPPVSVPEPGSQALLLLGLIGLLVTLKKNTTNS